MCATCRKAARRRFLETGSDTAWSLSYTHIPWIHKFMISENMIPAVKITEAFILFIVRSY
jgi:hypothetical protein